ncbi:hypothetical protein VTI28DRAFT_5996 [Corynascus sepedonium]
MADLEVRADAQQGQPAPRRGSSGTSSKIRDSCHACAVSKVKCPKEKPTCSRCESRGTTCQYFLTRRPGRRRENESNGGRSTNKKTSTDTDSSKNPNQNTDTNIDNGRSGEKEGDVIQAAPPSLSAQFLFESTTPPSSRLWEDNYPTASTPANPNSSISPRRDHVSAAANPSDVFPALGEETGFSELADFNPEVNDVDFVMSEIDTPFGLPLLDSSGGSSVVTGPRPDIGSLLMPLESNSADLTSSSSETSLGADGASSSSPGGCSSLGSLAQSLPAGLANVPCAGSIEIPSCGCLVQALDLLKVLCSNQSTPNTTSASGTPEPFSMVCDSGSSDNLARGALLKNKQSIETVNSMLQCLACADDNFLLTILSMIVLKTLERYAATARGRHTGGGGKTGAAGPSETDLGRVANMLMTNGAHSGQREDQGLDRKSAQLVLSELHRVQRVVNQLSPKLKAPSNEAGQSMGLDLDFWGQPWSHQLVAGVGGRRSTASPSFSTDTLSRLEKDVRKSLSHLSTDIIEVLRQS